jgi:hypothetical protein
MLRRVAWSIIRAMTHRPDDGGSKHLWNVGKLLPDYTAQHPIILAAVRTLNLTFSSTGHYRHCSVFQWQILTDTDFKLEANW